MLGHLDGREAVSAARRGEGAGHSPPFAGAVRLDGFPAPEPDRSRSPFGPLAHRFPGAGGPFSDSVTLTVRVPYSHRVLSGERVLE
jgi:hypothetical protein